MKPDVVKSKTDPKKYIGLSFLATFLLITNIIGWNKTIYTDMDAVFTPFVVATRSFAFSSNILLKEIANKSAVLQENIDLKRRLVEYDELYAINSDLRDQLIRMQQQTNVEASTERKIQLVRLSGAQNLYTSDPELVIELNREGEVKEGDVVLYSKSTLFGFVTHVEGKSARVVPYFSPRIKFNIPVQSSKDQKQRGFVEKIDNSRIKIRNVVKDTTVNAGDVWVTTNDVPEVLPNLSIGKIKSVENNKSESFQEIEIETPFVLSETNYLFIIPR